MLRPALQPELLFSHNLQFPLLLNYVWPSALLWLLVQVASSGVPVDMIDSQTDVWQSLLSDITCFSSATCAIVTEHPREWNNSNRSVVWLLLLCNCREHMLSNDALSLWSLLRVRDPDSAVYISKRLQSLRKTVDDDLVCCFF